jgi:hypothetical protein
MKNEKKKVKTTIIRRYHFLMVVRLDIKQKDCKLKQTKMAVRTAEITTIFRKKRVIALIALIVVDQVILRAIVSN